MSIGKHQSARMKNDEWLTPPEIVTSLGQFDLDPCSPINRPWDTALHHYNILDNGLIKEWFGRVFLNPPYGNIVDKWMKKMAEHDNGVALLFARTDRNTFHNYIFPFADSLLFIKQRLHFYDVNGVRAKANGGAPSVLIGYGEENSEAMANCGVKGKHILLNRVGVFVIGIDKTWKAIIHGILVNVNKPMAVDQIYAEVGKVAPDKVAKNDHYKEKIRQILQTKFKRTERAHYTLFD